MPKTPFAPSNAVNRWMLYSSFILLVLVVDSSSFAQMPRKAITIIFDNIPVYERNSSPFPKVKFIDDRPQLTIFDNFNKFDLNPKSLQYDTLRFYPNNENIVIRLLYKSSREPLHYVFDCGDTVSFSFKNGLPYAKSFKNTEESSLNYEYIRLVENKKLQQATALEIYKNPHLDMKRIEEDVFGYNIKKKWHQEAISYLVQEIDHITNYRKKLNGNFGTIDFLKDKMTHQINLIELEQHKIEHSRLKEIMLARKNKSTIGSYSYFYSLIQAVSDSVNVKKSKVISYKNGKEVDYREVYDRTESWGDISDFYKKHLQYSYLMKIGDIFQPSDLQIYLSRFSTSYRDTLLVNRIRKKFLTSDTRAIKKSGSLHLIGNKNKSSTFQRILDANKGKVIFVDFWASWCGPCREAMPASTKLREKFKTKNVVFVYLSLDDNINAWHKANEKEGLSNYSHSYVVTNIKSSLFLKKHNVSEIPRYMIFDRNGKLIYPNAPRVESNELGLLLTKLSHVSL